MALHPNRFFRAFFASLCAATPQQIDVLIHTGANGFRPFVTRYISALTKVYFYPSGGILRRDLRRASKKLSFWPSGVLLGPQLFSFNCMGGRLWCTLYNIFLYLCIAVVHPSLLAARAGSLHKIRDGKKNGRAPGVLTGARWYGWKTTVQIHKSSVHRPRKVPHELTVNDTRAARFRVVSFLLAFRPLRGGGLQSITKFYGYGFIKLLHWRS